MNENVKNATIYSNFRLYFLLKADLVKVPLRNHHLAIEKRVITKEH